MVRRRRFAKRLWTGFGQSGKDAAARRRHLQVEALEDRRLLALDFGDAPAPFPVGAEVNGARHEVITNWVDSGTSFLGGDSSHLYTSESDARPGTQLGQQVKISDDGNTILAMDRPGQVRLYRYDIATDSWAEKSISLDLPGLRVHSPWITINDSGDQFAVSFIGETPDQSVRQSWVNVYELQNNRISQIGGSLGPFVETYAFLSGAGNTVAIASQSSVQVMDWDGTYWIPRGSTILSNSDAFRWYNLALSEHGNRLLVPLVENTEVYQWDEQASSWDRLGGTLPAPAYDVHLAPTGDKVGIQGYGGFSIYSLDQNLNWFLDGDMVPLSSQSTQTSVSDNFDTLVTSIEYTESSEVHSTLFVYEKSSQGWGAPNLISNQRGLHFSISGDGKSLVRGDTQYDGDYQNEGKISIYKLAATLQFGDILTEDESGVNSEFANADSDDDGITFPSNIVVGDENLLDVSVRGGNGYVDAWVDFNQDGNWYGLGEKIMDSVPVSEGVNTLPFTVPSIAKPGVTYARFRLSEEGGLPPTGYATSGEVEDYEVVINSVQLDNTKDLDIEFRLDQGSLLASDTDSSNELVAYRSDIVPSQVSLLGNENHTTQVLFDGLTEHSSLDPTQIQTYSFVGGDTLGDGVTIESDPSLWAWLSSPAASQESLVIDLREGDQTLNRYEFQSVETINIGEVDRVAFTSDQFDIGATVYDLSPSKPVNLPLDTSIAGGTFRSTSTLGLHTAESLEGFGTIDAGFAGSRGSLVRLSGEMTIGDVTSSAGFNTDGLVEVGANALTIQDANQATLGELTALGDAAQPGAITAANGLYLDFTGNIEGYGTIETVNGDATNVFLNNGTLSGNSSEQPLYVNSLIKGVGTLNNVVIQGTFSPGFSPTLSVNGVVTYADQSNIEIELGGLLKGSQYDRIEHELAALAGQLDVKLIEGFLPMPGDLFEVIASAQPFVGSLNSVQMPVFENGIRLLERIGDSNIDLSTVFDVKDQLTVSDSEPGAFKILDWNGETLSINGDRFHAFVSPLNQFSAASVWWNDEVISTDAGWTQIATDGNHSIEIEGSGWKNFVRPSDVNNSGDVTSLDALNIINELSIARYSDEESRQLLPISEVGQWPGAFYDQNGDGACTALDALRVINDLARESAAAGEGEALPADYGNPFDVITDTTGVLISEFESLVTEAVESPSQFTSDYEDPGEPESVLAVEALTSGDSGQPQVDAVDKLLSDGFDWLK